MYGGSQVKL